MSRGQQWLAAVHSFAKDDEHKLPSLVAHLLKLFLNASVAELSILLTAFPTCWTTVLVQSEGMLGKHLQVSMGIVPGLVPGD